MVEDQGSGGWGKKAFFVVIGLAVPLVLWLLNRKEEATETPAGTSSARTPSSPPAQDSSPVATSPLQSPPAPTAPLTSSAPAQTPEPSDPIVTVPFSSAAAPGSEAPVVPPTAPEAREATPVAPVAAAEPAAAAATQDGTAHTLTDFVKTHPEEVVADATASAPPGENASDAPVFASPAATEGAEVEGNTAAPPVAEFAKGFPCDVEISDSDGKLHAAHLLSLDLKMARVRCERPLQASEKLRLTIKTKSGDTITPTGAITSVDGDQITLKLLKLNEGLRKRLQAFLDEQQQA